MRRKTSRTRAVLSGVPLILLGMYLLLALATGRPLRALAVELIGVITLWAIYAGRFAFNAPLVLAPEVLWFRVKDRARPPPLGAVVFTGSSTIAHWRFLADDMAPLPVVNRGINGARLSQIAHYADQLVLPHRPRAVVLYAGENDLAGFLGSRRQSPEEVLAAFQSLCEKIHARLPEVTVDFISIKPTRARAASATAFQRANALVKQACAVDPRLNFIDAVPALLGADGRARSDVFEVDGIHLNEEGYRILTSVVRPCLLARQ
jgi:lysophospholipase L1-like esterase